MTPHIACKKLAALFFGSPERDRLAGAINETKTDLKRQIDGGPGSDWKATAEEFLQQAEDYLDGWNLQQGWVALAAAQRAILLNPNDPDRVLRAGHVLRRETEKEVEKVTGWRAKAIKDLLCGLPEHCYEDGKDGGKKDGIESKITKDDNNTANSAAAKQSKEHALTPEMCKRVIDAIALRDDQANTTYFKILLRRRSLVQLSLILWVGIIVCAGLSAFHALPAPFNAARQVAAVIVFGVLGATLSVGHSLMTANISAKIPSQQIGSVVVWMRPGIGAAAALIAFAFIHANETLGIFKETWGKDFKVIIAIAVAAGFSERFIVGAIDRISQLGDKDKSKDKDKAE